MGAVASSELKRDDHLERVDGGTPLGPKQRRTPREKKWQAEEDPGDRKTPGSFLFNHEEKTGPQEKFTAAVKDEEDDGHVLAELHKERMEHKATRAELQREKDGHEATKKELQKAQEELEQALKATKVNTKASQLEVAVAWEYRVSEDEWSPYKAANNDEITVAFLDEKESCKIFCDGKEYEIKFQGMMQRNCKTNIHRDIRLNPKMPPHWLTTKEDMLKRLRGSDGLTDVEEATTRPAAKSLRQRVFGMLARLLRDEATLPARPADNFPLVKVEDREMLSSMQSLLRELVYHHDAALPPCTNTTCTCLTSQIVVVEAWHVENIHLYLLYLEWCHEMRRRHSRNKVSIKPIAPEPPAKLRDFGEMCGIPKGGQEVNEQLLLHGTRFEDAQQIALEGFDNRVCREGMYGHGTYFALQSCKSHQYARMQDGLHTVILARVAVGDPYYAKSIQSDKEHRPPRRVSGGPLYDSVVAQPGPMQGHGAGYQSHMELVSFDQRQAYPEYIVRYRLAREDGAGACG